MLQSAASVIVIYIYIYIAFLSFFKFVHISLDTANTPCGLSHGIYGNQI